MYIPTLWYLKETEFFDDYETATALADKGCESKEQWQVI
jgi:hypothetical protein